MGYDEKGYREFLSEAEIDAYTIVYKDVYTGIPLFGIREFTERLKKATLKEIPEMPDWGEKEIKSFFRFPEDADLYQIAKDASVHMFITAYCGGNYYHAMNEYLRFGGTRLEGCFNLVKSLEDHGGEMAELRTMPPDEIVEMMNDVFCRYPTKEDMVLWRVVNTKKDFENPFGYLKKSEYTDKGFLSCGSILENLLKSDEYKDCNLILKLRVPKGTPSLYVDYISRRNHEKEWLLPPGCKVCQISQPKRHKGRLMVECGVKVDERLLAKKEMYEQLHMTHQPTYYVELKKREDENLRREFEASKGKNNEALSSKIEKATNIVKSNSEPKKANENEINNSASR